MTLFDVRASRTLCQVVGEFSIATQDESNGSTTSLSTSPEHSQRLKRSPDCKDGSSWLVSFAVNRMTAGYRCILAIGPNGAADRIGASSPNVKGGWSLARSDYDAVMRVPQGCNV